MQIAHKRFRPILASAVTLAAAAAMVLPVDLGSVGVAQAATDAVTPNAGPAAGGTRVALPALPQKIKFVSIAAGRHGAYAIGNDKKVYAWGANNAGQLGNQNTSNSFTPVEVSVPKATKIAAGGDSGYAIADDGNTYAWGLNNYGQLGNQSTVDSSTPVRVQLPAGVKATHIAAGYYSAYAIGDDGNTYAWGRNDGGQLGNQSTVNSSTPVKVKLPAGLDGVELAAGAHSGYVSLDDGSVYAWGRNNAGQLGDGSNADTSTPVKVKLPELVWAYGGIAAGQWNAYLVGNDEKVYAWGENNFGQLGNQNNINSLTPVMVNLPTGVTARSIAAGGDAGYLIGNDGNAYAWGRNDAGQLGNQNTTAMNTPVRVKLPEGVKVLQIAGGTSPDRAAAYAIGDDGNTYAWGQNDVGQLGNQNNINSLTPVMVNLPAKSGVVTSVKFGDIPVTDITVQEDGSLEVESPAHPGGLVDVTVDWTVDGVPQSPVVYPQAFTFTQNTTGSVSRIAGASRYETAANVSKASFTQTGGTVFLANGLGIPDALAAAPVAAIRNSPVLLVERNAIPAPAAEELKRLKPKTVIFLGGSGVLSDAMVTQVQQVSGASTVERWAGSTRYDTAAEVAKRAFPGSADTVYVAGGVGLPDALAAAPVAGIGNAPILLVAKDSVPASTQQRLAALQPKKVVVLGGAGVVSKTVESKLQTAAGSNPVVTRWEGSDRYDTAGVVTVQGFGTGAGTVYVAGGLGLPDALAAAPVAGMGKAPVLLVESHRVPAATDDALKKLKAQQPIRNIVVLGGTGVVSDQTMNALKGYLE